MTKSELSVSVADMLMHGMDSISLSVFVLSVPKSAKSFNPNPNKLKSYTVSNFDIFKIHYNLFHTKIENIVLY